MSDAKSYELFINGKWRAGGSRATLPVINPATEEVFASVASATVSDLDEALASAERSRRAWSSRPAKERGEILVSAASILAEKAGAAARDLSCEQGKTIAEATGEYARAVETLEWNGRHADELSAPIPLGSNRMIAPEPLGVVAAFTPWNYPAVLIARKLAPALAAGCPVILKGAEETPSVAVHIVESLRQAGIPEGVVNLVFGVPVHISRHLLSSPIVKVLTFTGSTAVGKQLATLAANNLQRCILELGGHSPVIVCEDADLAKVIPAISEYKFECAGQSCNAPSRILVARSRWEEFLFRMTEAVRKIRIGPPDDPATQMGPMANARRIEAMQRLTKDAVEGGARIETGGTPLDRPGFYWPPTILTGVPKEARVLHEEPFGPILTVAPFDTIEEAIEEANATEYGLAAYLFTGVADTQEKLINGLSAGAVSVNYLKGVSADAPYGGVKQSGYGYEGGEQGVRSFQILKMVNGLGSFG
ncbi:MAG: NAD-dependent succinate-semialdehyde dehydrogenase [Mesorhizobium sp.]|uniref:NAD-dependent succinate-semialdehyde dehydrogenase n=1 Tax=Mesorhizobium sp. TaxID=1871066 RepID=UPI000FEA33B8|nr:NAD-dependent succinate-semialdehyde dehydrogenase [Mesorhizobium sp.]RWH31414.1 MAG: NAD-dependent succinate-semialdehyde dehydrogenase [Mesorhizobium sp.]RWH38671.1 MAG: NAD-dependent succinate-semialdehyde dehydrogenase [Mesorhizobium sp.]TIM70816.1 MAG: NAD-dependent succinate-semialdehyde dehydrogenase [Mesorhizobium sp.]TIO05254.1 MAG: NAD-dependent succinate-semialdehyde dehydrogenase [Mesorhizobium sp.]TIR58065.1 MAG: NAD-dependent succinate-semialdehyde dehydrogenase [Mesorhizobium